MERLTRWLFNGVAAISFALFLLTIILWIWSNADTKTYHLIFNMHGISIGSSVGNVLYEGPPKEPQVWTIYVAGQTPRAYNGIGPTTMLIPCWEVAPVVGTVPVIWLIIRLRSKRHIMESHCKKCGYDLRATPDRCPECGTVPTKTELTSH
jgi:hypothetical protein